MNKLIPLLALAILACDGVPPQTCIPRETPVASSYFCRVSADCDEGYFRADIVCEDACQVRCIHTSQGKPDMDETVDDAQGLDCMGPRGDLIRAINEACPWPGKGIPTNLLEIPMLPKPKLDGGVALDWYKPNEGGSPDQRPR